MTNMMFQFQRRYTGQVQGVVFDWAGTLVDYGCFAPTMVFVEGFRSFGVEITIEEARLPMGKYKRDHIQEIVHMPRIATLWRQQYGHDPREEDLNALFADFAPRQLAIIAQYSDPIPGVVETLQALRARGIGIGSCTGYTREMMDILAAKAQEKGCAPDTLVTPDEVGSGRPAPWMCFRNAELLGVYPMEALVKVGDTTADIQEGLNAGMWTVGIARTGNEMGLMQEDVLRLPAADLHHRLTQIRGKLFSAGAHFVIESTADLLPVIDQINIRLQQAVKP